MMQCAGIDVHRGRRRLSGYRRIAERGIQTDMLVIDGDELRRPPAGKQASRNSLLIETDLGTGSEKQILDASHAHGNDQCFANVFHGNLGPFKRIRTSHAVVVCHFSVLCIRLLVFEFHRSVWP